MKTEIVVFFDGICGLCNGFVDFVIKMDDEKKVRFSPLQSTYAKKELPPALTADMQSVIVKKEGQLLQKSSAVLAVLESIGLPTPAVMFLKSVPEFLRDRVYDYVADGRYEWFGKRDTCRVPTPEEKSRFILGDETGS